MIRVQNVTKRYKDVKALDSFCYDFDCGIYAVLGPNGSGKSTLMNIITSNLSPDSGTVTLQSRTGTLVSDDRRIGYVPQYPGMYPNFTVYEMLDYIAILNRAEKKEEQIAELISVFDLKEYTSKKIRALSGGTRQRLAIAQSLIGSPELVVMDEPTAGLDPMQRIAFKNFLSQQKEKMTVLISTHIVSDVEEIADEVIFLKKGTVVKSGSLKNVTEDLRGKCWSVHSEGELEGGDYLHRVVGNEVRVISGVKPSPDAVPIEATLEECYLDIFGVE